MHLLDTILLRPYVFAFLLFYLVGCSLHLGMKRTLLFGITGYGIAWLSEYSSIHTGFPYGRYCYIETTRGQEAWVLGVPLMDSLSYVFLAYASYALALFVIAPVRRSGPVLYVLESKALRRSLHTASLAAFFFVYLDIIIDPVALQGERWFLGKLYEYPAGGDYFGVPLSNFAGWFLTGFALIVVLQWIDRILDQGGVPDRDGRRYAWRYLIGPALYIAVIVFNLSVTFCIGETTMGWTGTFIVLLPSVLILLLTKVKLNSADAEAEWAAHLRDFPADIEVRRQEGAPLEKPGYRLRT